MLSITSDQLRAISDSQEVIFKERLRDFFQKQLAGAGTDIAALPIDAAIERVLSTAASINVTSEKDAASCVILYLLAYASNDSEGNNAAIGKMLSESSRPIDKRIQDCIKLFD